ncbi:MAG: hypothetical protein FWD78_00560 [Treponema sp.]|nr:hypothetical protein [Treponema sp.]
MEVKFNNAYVKYKNGLLEVSTGIISRTWEWRQNGFATAEIIYSAGGRVCQRNCDIDYNVFGLFTGQDLPAGQSQRTGQTAELRGIDSRVVQDGLTSPHLEVTAITTYPVLLLSVKYVIWVYPDAPGLRTRLYVKSFGGYKPAACGGESVTETLCFPQTSRIKAAGFYNDTQHRNTAATEILREENFNNPDRIDIDWANLIALYGSGGGVCVVKESNKCVNQSSYDTGSFKYHNGILTATGLGLKPQDIKEDRYLFGWASWTICFDGTDDGLEKAIKEFDRFRFPVNKNNDIYIMSNIWGSTTGVLARDSACSDIILKEIPVAAELGVDVLQVDAGWHSPMGLEKKAQPEVLPWYTHGSKFAEGWVTISGPAADAGLKLGLWFPWLASADEIIDNMRLGNFEYFKIDWANLNTRERLDGMIEKAEKVYAAGSGNVRINWDVTENAPRMGYYFGREFGNIYLSNRKPHFPVNAVYVPYLVLRDCWQLSKYANINKFQIILQNIDMIDRDLSDACLHNFSYCAMIAFIGSPILFQQVHLLSAQAKHELKNIIAVYKKHRQAMYNCYVYPVGDKPDNSSWTGFQFVNDGQGRGEQSRGVQGGGGHGDGGYGGGTPGFIILFRELNNKNNTQKIKLRFLKNCRLQAINAMTGEKLVIGVDSEGCAEFSINDPCGFLWYRYGE